MNVLTWMCIIVGAVCTLLLAFKKWGWLDWYATYRPVWLPEADCWLCLGFWASLLLLVPVAMWVGWWFMLVLAFPCAAFINLMMNTLTRHD